MTAALLYHDVVANGEWSSSGFNAPEADIYKLDADEFRRHLEALRRRGVDAASVVLTFDDGGASAAYPTLDILEEFGRVGRFFIATDFVGRAGFLTAAQIRGLRRRGHAVGSHSCSHPERMSQCTHAQLLREWRCSIAMLADLLGEEVDTASVPGGYYAPRVARAAGECGVRLLYTSEPTARLTFLDEVCVSGRYSVRRGTPAAIAAALAHGDVLPRMQQAAWWAMKKAAKRAGGRHWLEFRRHVLSRRGKRP